MNADYFQFAGYARVVLALISFYFMPTNYVLASWCYVTSALLDAFDGHAARIYDQSNITPQPQQIRQLPYFQPKIESKLLLTSDTLIISTNYCEQWKIITKFQQCY